MPKGVSIKLTLKIMLSLETENGYVFGEGLFKILSKIEELGTLRGATKELGITYRRAWGKIEMSEQRIGKPLLETIEVENHREGAKLTTEARLLIDKYLDIKGIVKGTDQTVEFI